MYVQITSYETVNIAFGEHAIAATLISFHFFYIILSVLLCSSRDGCPRTGLLISIVVDEISLYNYIKT